MTTAISPHSTAAKQDQPRHAARIHGESRYDRVTSFLMAIVLGALMIVGLLGLIYVTNQAFASRVTAPLQIIEVAGGGGGSPDGTPGSTEKIDVAGADAANLASNNEEEAGDFEEPATQTTPGAMLESLTARLPVVVCPGWLSTPAQPIAVDDVVAYLTAALDLPPGEGRIVEIGDADVVPYRALIEEYARQLDALKVELAAVTGPDQLTYISNLSSAEPTKRFGSGQSDGRLYFLWQGRGRKTEDLALLKKAGIDVGDGVVLQFYPKGVEDQLAQLEVRYRGRQPGEIRVTRFSVVPKGDGYGFQVLAQETLR